MKYIEKSEFKKLMSEKEVLVVQFSAQWCGPCKTISTLIDNNKDKLSNDIYKMDIDKNPKLASVLGIRSIPTIIRFENEKEKKRIVGLQEIEQIIEIAL